MKYIKNRSRGLIRQIDLDGRVLKLCRALKFLSEARYIFSANLVIAKNLSVLAFALVIAMLLTACFGGVLPKTESPGREVVESGIKPPQSLVGAAELAKAFEAAGKGGKRAPGAEPLSISPLPESRAVVAFYRTGEVAYFPKGDGAGQVALSFGDNITAGAIAARVGLVALANKEIIHIYSYPNFQLRYSWDTLKSRVTSLDFSPDGRSLLMGGADGMVYRWRFADVEKAQTEREKEELFERYFGHASIVSLVKFHPFGRVFFSSDWSGVVLAWLRYDSDQFGGEYDQNLLTGPFFTEGANRMKLGRVDTDQIEALALTPDGKVLLVATQAGNIELWKTRGLKKEASILGHKGLIYDAAIGSSGTRIISSGRDGKLKNWKVTKAPDPTGVTIVWTLQEDGVAAEGLDVRRLACREDGSCVGATSLGKVIALPFSVKE